MPQKKLLNFLKDCKHSLILMEVCGTHTVAISKNGLRSLLPPNIRLISGPGCPVCVTPQSEIDASIELARRPKTIITSFGDMIRVPGTRTSLEKEKAEGSDVRVVYSPLDCLDIAKKEPEKEVVFIGVGFETTSPAIAATVLKAKEEKAHNFSVIPAFKLIPPALQALTGAKDVRVDGFILPGHVSTIIGADAYGFLEIPGVIAGFEAEDILEAIGMIVKLIRARSRVPVQIQYRSVVRPEGNPAAIKVLYEVFEPSDSNWRGIGTIKGSGLVFRDKYREFDALKKFDVNIQNSKEPAGCSCGSILKGIKTPPECKLFGKKCTPEYPVGPCMVSSEGACSAYYKYGNN